MKLLSKQNFEKATRYVKENADAISSAWYAYNLKGMTDTEFITELQKYQFDNGGFGGLIYEYEYQGPCLKSTEHAFRYMYYMKNKPSADHPMIQKMMKYVLSKYRPEIGCWGDLLEPEVNDGLHVRWWKYGEDEHKPKDDFDERVKQYSPNGQAALAAFVALYPEIVSKDLYEDIIRYPIEKIRRYYDSASALKGTFVTNAYFSDEIQIPYNMKCLSQFCDCLKDKKLADELREILKQNPTACMDLDESCWHEGYHETPCDIVTFPESFLYAGLKEIVDNSIDYFIDRQSENGGWLLTYRFGKEDGFRTLENKFNVHFTVLMLALLNRFGRIER